jgi:putative restriction endonuclease
MPEPASTLAQAIEAIYRLNVGVVGHGEDRHERPHKPVLLLAVLDLIAQGKATPDRVVWCRDLRERFALYFQHVRKRDDRCTPDNPFLYLRKEGWWQPVRYAETGAHPLDAPPSVQDAKTSQVWASISSPVAPWMLTAADRLQLRNAIIARYFPHARALLSAHFVEDGLLELPQALETPDLDTGSAPGRSAGFRRVILEIYDHQCVACGLRIRVPQRDDLSLVEAAHLIPFSEPEFGGNDHPSNGIALCKNHHWAMDRFLITPTPNGLWRVSSIIDARRSNGESELRALDGKPLLKPLDDAFKPAEEALYWRLQRLAA